MTEDGLWPMGLRGRRDGAPVADMEGPSAGSLVRTPWVIGQSGSVGAVWTAD